MASIGGRALLHGLGDVLLHLKKDGWTKRACKIFLSFFCATLFPRLNKITLSLKC